MPKYDLAIAGAGLGGLAAAALMSSRGKKVIVYESGSPESALGVRACDGFRFFRGPSLSYGFEQRGVCREFFAKLSDSPLPSMQHAPCFQVALPDRRITVSANRDETLDELRREFPREVRSIEKFYRDIRKESEHAAKSRFSFFLAKHRPALRFLRKYAFSRELTLFFDIQSRYFFHRPIEHLSTATLMLLCETMPVQFYGGNRTLAKHFLSVLRKNGGEAHYGKEQAEVAFKKNRAIGIAIGGNVSEADTVLVCAEPGPSAVQYLGIFDDVVPVGMVRDVLYLPEYARHEEFLALSLSAQDDPASAPQSARALTVALQSKRDGKNLQDAVAGPLSEIMPFLNDNLYFTEQAQPPAPSFRLPADISFKRSWSAHETELLFRSSKRNLYVLQEAPHMPTDLLSVVQKFVKHIS